MLNPYFERLDIAHIMRLADTQFQQTLYYEKEIAAGDQFDGAKEITAEGHFILLSITGSFTTLDFSDPDVIDDGVNHLFIQLSDLTHHKELFDDFMDASLFLSPGRSKSALVPAADDSQPLRIEYPFVYPFPVNSVIGIKVKNDSGYANKIKLGFKGIRVYTELRNGA